MEVRERIALVIDFERRLGVDVIRRTPAVPAFEELAHRACLVLEEALELCAALGVDVTHVGVGQADPTAQPHTSVTPIRTSGVLRYQAVKPPNLVEAVDALRDLEYVMYGTEATLGVQEVTDETFLEVHRSNLAKLESGEVKDGKPVKPAGWKPPQLRRILQRQFPKQALLF